MKEHRYGRSPSICKCCGKAYMARNDGLKIGRATCCSKKCSGRLGKAAMGPMALPAIATHKEKQRANGLVNMRQRKGKLTPPPLCQQCGAAKKLDKHHENYSCPGDIVWLCRSCHMKRHWNGKPLELQEAAPCPS